MKSMNEIDHIYFNLCYALTTSAEEVRGTRELNNIRIELKDINQNIVSIRNLSASYLFGEWLWYFAGRNDVDFISAYGSMWEKLSDDGKTNNSAYGYLMQKAFGFNQIEKVIELLRVDPTSRRAVININTPNARVIETKDEPCTIALQFLIRNNKLYCTAIMRSNDIWLGFPYDVAFFTELQKYIADELGIGYGTYTHFVVSLHLYEKNYAEVSNIVENPIPVPIEFDRKKFHQNKQFIVDAMDVARRYMGKGIIKNLTLEYMEKLCDFKQER